MEKLTCKRCGHTWMPRVEGRPGQCPECHNTRWDTARIKPMKTCIYKCKCGTVVEKKAYVFDPLKGNGVCEKCGGHLWLMFNDWPTGWCKKGGHCKGCGEKINEGDEFTVNILSEEWRGETWQKLVLYHLKCTPDKYGGDINSSKERFNPME